MDCPGRENRFRYISRVYPKGHKAQDTPLRDNNNSVKELITTAVSACRGTAPIFRRGPNRRAISCCPRKENRYVRTAMASAGIAIILVVITINFIGDALRDAFEVRLQRR